MMERGGGGWLSTLEMGCKGFVDLSHSLLRRSFFTIYESRSELFGGLVRIEMADNNGNSNASAENQNHNSNESINPTTNQNDASIDAIAQKVQESLTLSKRHKFWETQPVGQFKDVGNSTLPEGAIEPPTPLSEVKQEPYNLPVTRLLREYLKQFIVAPDFDENDVEHWLLPKEDVVDSFLVESSETRDVTDFCSFYTLPSTILGNQNYSTLKAAYSYYNVSTKTPMLQLMNDALIVAKKKGYDVFNALDVMENEGILKELKFGPGDGQLHYYLYNYRLNQPLRPSELGLVLL
ncbi:unnamed protein product [Lactuca saligna]|uniref:Glycylpeptide N-tetradecanoyltransferase n=1 Tax=Lactuca saligna TaxID=75948 RepID=A0AA36E424_LACSI|nr:unnamed protein product [Lactuca saligna]